MSGVNKVILLGRLGRDPELRETKSGTKVVSFSVATSETWKDKTSGEKQEKTEWHNCVAFGKLAEICGTYLKKGSQAYVEGKLQTDKYEKDGVTKYSTKIVASEVTFIGGKSEGSSNAEEASSPEEYFDGDADGEEGLLE